MQVTRKVTTEVNVDAIRCVLAVRYDEEDMPNDYPHRKHDTWDVTIDVATGQIRDWPTGVSPNNLYMKVCDSGNYYLLSGSDVIGTIEHNYVPACIPSAYGDYIDFKIDGSGRITNWSFGEDEAQEAFFESDQ